MVYGIKVTSKSYTPELEGLTIKCRPFYLLREFQSLLLTAVYISPDANANSAITQLSKVITEQENANPGAHSIIVGDFNHCNLKKSPTKVLSACEVPHSKE